MRSGAVDVLVVGGTPAGCAAALSAARSGKSVCLLEPTRALGGMNANGVDAFDTGSLQAISGIAEEFGTRIAAHYAKVGLHDPLFESRTEIFWENHVAAAIWRRMMEEAAGVEILFGAVAIDVVVQEGCIREVLWERAIDAMGNLDPSSRGPIHSARGRIVIDATYEGDIAAWAGVPFRLGREARSPDEPHAGIIYTTYLDRHISDGYPPYTILPGSTGEADDRIMAFNCRLCCKFYSDRSPGAPHRLKAPPPGYEPKNYKWDPAVFFPDGKPRFGTGAVPGVNGKFHLNRMFDGNDLVGPNREYVLARPLDRRVLRQRFVDHALGFLYFIQTEGGTPELGLSDDEFIENDNIPFQIYVREGRRIEGVATITEADVNPFLKGEGLRPPLKSDAIAIGDYEIDIKKCRDVRTPGRIYPEGMTFFRALRAPFQVPYGCLTPKAIDNLLVACALSATHVAYGAIRLEGIWFQTGMAAGIAAALSLEHQCRVADAPLAAIQETMIARNGKLTYFADVGSDHPSFAAIQWAALRSYVPLDWKWRFYPDQPVTWSDFVIATVICLDLPISVTGMHFENINPDHPAFRYLETLYDLGSRAGVDTFPGMHNPRIDTAAEFHRAEERVRFLYFDAHSAVTCREIVQRLCTILEALGRSCDRSVFAECNKSEATISRGQLCQWLARLAKERRETLAAGQATAAKKTAVGTRGLARTAL